MYSSAMRLAEQALQCIRHNWNVGTWGLHHDPYLDAECQAHNAWMVHTGQFEHSGLWNGRENIAVVHGSPSPIDAMNIIMHIWESDSGHLSNLLQGTGAWGVALYWAPTCVYATFRFRRA